MTSLQNLKDKASHGSFGSYTVAFVFSIVMTIDAYLAATRKSFSNTTILWSIAAFAVVQLLIQLIFFLHIGREPKPKWNTYILAFAVFMIFAIVAGSIWIMNHLNYHSYNPSQYENNLVHDEGLSH